MDKILVLILAMGLGACGIMSTTSREVDKLPTKVEMDHLDLINPALTDNSDNKAELNELRRQKAALDAKIAAKELEIKQNRIDRLVMISYWVAGISILVTLVCVFLYMFSTIGKGIILSIAIASLSTFIASMVLVELIEYIVPISIALAISLIAYVIYALFKSKVAIKKTAELADKLEKATTPSEYKEIKKESFYEQKKLGIANMVAAIRGKPLSDGNNDYVTSILGK